MTTPASAPRYERIEGHCSTHDGVPFYVDHVDDSGFCPMCEYEQMVEDATDIATALAQARAEERERIMLIFNDYYAQDDGWASRFRQEVDAPTGGRDERT